MTVDQIKQKALEKFGGYPVVFVFEHPHPFRSINLYLIDIGKIDSECENEIGFVDDILNAALDGCESIDTTGRYCFSDTKEWWSRFMPDEVTEETIKTRIRVDIR